MRSTNRAAATDGVLTFPTHRTPAESTLLSAGVKQVTSSDQSEQSDLWEAGLKETGAKTEHLKKRVIIGIFIQTEKEHNMSSKIQQICLTYCVVICVYVPVS